MFELAEARGADETTNLDKLDKEVIKFKLKVKCKKPPQDSADKEPINGKVLLRGKPCIFICSNSKFLHILVISIVLS